MKAGVKLCMATLCVFIFIAATKQPGTLSKAAWLIGTWENKTSRGTIYETWKKNGKDEFSGKSYIIKEKDTITFETIRLVQTQSGVFYIPVVKDQNDGQPVKFEGKMLSDSQLVFENLQHDFPQVITYTKINKDSLVATISGIKNGKERKQFFPMKRRKP